jgi:hypothetical protein
MLALRAAGIATSSSISIAVDIPAPLGPRRGHHPGLHSEGQIIQDDRAVVALAQVIECERAHDASRGVPAPIRRAYVPKPTDHQGPTVQEQQDMRQV